MLFDFDNSYARLPARFYARLDPTAVARPSLIRLNRDLATELGIDPQALDTATAAALAAGNLVPPGAEPIALAYAGHQFGHFVPQLGDGRAILLGEVVDRAGRRRDIQLKGSGRTPFSRRGDGRAALGPVLREYVVSEAMHALGIPTTRALAAATTGEPVYREDVLPGAVLTRVAASHVRVGTFQYFAARDDQDAIARLVDHVIARHDPAAAQAERPALTLLAGVAERQAQLVARWMQVGFIHGVMNTDNMTISGETIDFGPCAFMDTYDPKTVFSAIDDFGRYAYANQPGIAQWNLARLAEALLARIDPEPQRAIDLATDVVVGFRSRYEAHWLDGMRRKLGLFHAEDDDRQLAEGFLDALHAGGADFTLAFRRLGEAARGAAHESALRAMFTRPGAYESWATAWRARLAREPRSPDERAAAMNGVNPLVIPRNHRVEQAIAAAVTQADFGPFERLLQAVERPFDERPADDVDARPPAPEERVCRTFCGT
ncbi:MAG: YdiU family protein [Alphaproteobacteria bacterium]|nr:YdiU family protein [Alphaproteobacteria bacterium]